MSFVRFWRTPATLAWRDLKHSGASGGLILVAMAISVAGIGGVHSAANIARETLRGDSRAWLGGDIGIDTRDPVDGSQAAGLDKLRATGIDWTLVTTAMTMASSDQSPDPGFINVKAVDPAKYPFYGNLVLNPQDGLPATGTAAVSQEVLDRLQIAVGDTIRIAGRLLRISSVIEVEPDRFSGSAALGMRCIVSRDEYARMDLEDAGVSVRNRVLLRLPASESLDDARRALEQVVPGGSIRDYRGAYQRQTESVISFLSVTSFLALLLGAAGMGVATRYHFDQRTPIFAILRTLGARNGQLAIFFSVQIGCILLTALAVGVLLSFGVRASILSLAGKYLALPRNTGWDSAAVLETAAAALATIAPAIVHPALKIRDLRPTNILRAEQTPIQDAKWGAPAWIVAAISSTAFAALAFQLLHAWLTALLLLAALAACIGAAFALSVAALRLLRRCSSNWKRMPLIRHGLVNLCRTGNRNSMVIISLATALTILVATFETSSAIVRAIFSILPFDQNSLYITRFRSGRADGLKSFIQHQPGVENVQVMAQARLELRGVGGLRSSGFKPRKDEAAIDSPQMIVCDPSLAAAGTRTANLVASSDALRDFGLTVGSLLSFDGLNGPVQAKVVAIRNFTPAERVWGTLRMDCSDLNPSELLYQAAVHVRADDLDSVRKSMLNEYPQLAVLTPEEITGAVSQVSNDAMALTRTVTWYAIVAGLLILVAVVASTRAARLHEIGVLSALGAPRSSIVTIYTVEFAAIGLLSGLFAAILATGFESAMLSIVLQRAEWNLGWRAVAVSVPVCAVSTVAAGWLGSARMLKMKPAVILNRF